MSSTTPTMSHQKLIDYLTELLSKNMVKIERTQTCVRILKRPQQAVRNDILQVRTEMISPVPETQELSTAPQSQPKSPKSACLEKSHFKWSVQQENRLFFLCLKGACRKYQSQIIQREPMHIFSKVQKHILLLKKVSDSFDETILLESQKRYMQGDMNFMKYITYLENICNYIKFEFSEDSIMHNFIPESQGSGKKD
jgi:hypothetical protein